MSHGTIYGSIMNHEPPWPVWDDMQVPLGSSYPGAASPTRVKYGDDGAGSTGVRMWSFSTSQEQSLEFEAQMPHKWLAGTPIKPHFHYIPGAGGAGNVVFGFEYTVAAIGAQVPTTTIYEEVTAVSPTPGAHSIVGFSPIDLPATSVSQMLICRVARVGDAVADTYDTVIWGKEFDFHYQIDSGGSRAEFTK